MVETPHGVHFSFLFFSFLSRKANLHLSGCMNRSHVLAIASRQLQTCTCMVGHQVQRRTVLRLYLKGFDMPNAACMQAHAIHHILVLICAGPGMHGEPLQTDIAVKEHLVWCRDNGEQPNEVIIPIQPGKQRMSCQKIARLRRSSHGCCINTMFLLGYIQAGVYSVNNKVFKRVVKLHSLWCRLFLSVVYKIHAMWFVQKRRGVTYMHAYHATLIASPHVSYILTCTWTQGMPWVASHTFPLLDQFCPCPC